MKTKIVSGVLVGVLTLVAFWAGVARAQSPDIQAAQTGMMAQQQMPMGPMMQQMQGGWPQMNLNTAELRTLLEQMRPELMTSQQRLMYDYLKTLQTHLETMQSMLGTMQGMMQAPR